MNDATVGRRKCPALTLLALLGLLLLLLAACSSGSPSVSEAETGVLTLPPVSARAEEGQRLRVVATTSIIGDVVGRVGGGAIDLTTLMRPGQDPHSYQPAATDLTAAADADVIFINGWNLEEALVGDLESIGRRATIVPVSAGIEPLAAGEGAANPHVWLDVAHVIRWVENVRQVLGAADPANAATYDANAAAYRAELEQLDADLRATLATIPPARRVLVTNHDNLGYFATAYGFEVAGTVIPSVSALAEPTAKDLSELVGLMTAEGICALVVETTANDQLARMLERELTDCDEVHLITLYTDALGPPGSAAADYIGMMRANAAALVAGLT